MAEAIEPIQFAQVGNIDRVGSVGSARVNFTGNAFEDVLSKAVDALGEVSQTEYYADKLIDQYVNGKAELADVMLATSKMNIMVQLAVTVVNSTVNTFKEITQMQI